MKLWLTLKATVERGRLAALGVLGPLAMVGVLICLLLAWGVSRAAHAGEVLSGVWVNEFVASGLERSELERELEGVAKRLKERPVRVHLEGIVFRISPPEIDTRLNVPATTEEALVVGRQRGVFAQFLWWLSSFSSAERLAFTASYDPSKLEALIEKWERAAISDPPVPGDVRTQGDSLVFEEPRAGRRIDRKQLSADLKQVLGRTSDRVVTLRTELVRPKLGKSHVQRAFERAKHLVRAPVQLVSRDGKLILDLSSKELAQAVRTKPETNPLRLGVYFDPESIGAVIEKDKRRLESEPQDASFRVDKENRVTIVPGRPGTRLDASAIAEAVMHAALSEAHIGELPVDRDALPAFTTEAARALNITKLVARFSTRHACCQARVQNIHRIADILDGTIVKPGEVFSVNEKVGPRTVKNGFVPAPTIVEGDMEDTVGGGVSQFATTLFNALLYGGYDIVERQPHSYWFPRYPMGHEATLSYPKPDIIFRNDTKSGVLIKTEYTDTRITVKLFGDNEGRKVKATVSPRQDIIDPPVKLVGDPSMPPDEEKVLDAGMVGWSVIAGRVITFLDKTQKVEKRKVTYMPRVRKVRVHPCRIPEGEEGYTGKDCPEPEDAELPDEAEEARVTEPPSQEASEGDENDL